MKKSTLKRILASILFAAVFFTSPSSAVTAEEAIESVDTSDYAPGLFYPYYDYKGEGMEFAPFTLTLDYEPDEDGIYQVSRANTGNTVSYVYQLTQDGVIELAYFPNSYEAEDFRYHEDSLDEQVATFFPVELAVGDTFKRGYRDEQEFTVTDILTEHEVECETYHDVFVIETVMPEGEVQRYFYAPEIGEIASEYIFDDEGNAITTALSEYGEVPTE
ncbi:hypothetical protein [Ruoffia tabacinasalis]|uniref:Uncharacterized protein n=1 Tax=Ruoffia tabacinasalis TaxID=87458 RepID=A0ABS0LGP5_9LACT|nr:hypothetical protein [Ruoffia tabacinasalis]MBG9977172.1 hypothetical protein [Ruoffia tabacinasalis]